MTPEQVDRVERSWRSVLPVGDAAAELFYGKLFSLDPGLQSRFKNDMREQGRNLAAMISVAVGSLSKPERITLAVRQLGRRHVLGEAFTPAVRYARADVYDLLAATMQDACAYS